MYTNTYMTCNFCPMYIYCYGLQRSENPSQVSKRIFRSTAKNFTTEEALEIGKELNIDFRQFDVEQLRMGLCVELEHGVHNPNTNVTNDDPLITGKIALAHLNEFPDYYTRLNKMEEEAEAYWKKEEFH